MMGVESNFELFTFLWGWHQYEALWNILIDTGIVFIPFVGIILNAFLSAYGSQEPGQAAFATIRALEINILSSLIVIIIAAQPIVKVEVGALEFVRVCVGSKFVDRKEQIPDLRPEVGLGRIRMSEFEQVKLPAWWFGVLSISHGITHAAKKGLPCLDDIRQLRIAVHTHVFKDIDTINELMLFGNQCYLKALSKFNEDQRNGTFPDDSTEGLLRGDVFKMFGTNDTAWMGSQYFYLSQKYYEQISVERESITTGVPAPVSCVKEWERVRDLAANALSDLEDPISEENIVEFFLKKLSDTGSIFPSFRLNTAISNREGPGTNAQEYIVGSNLLRAIVDSNIIFDPITFAKDPNWGFTYKHYQRIAADLGQKKQAVSHYGTVDIFIRSIPFVGGILLFGMYAFLPLGLVFSGYSLQFLLVASLAIFGIKFYYYLWHLVWWLDQNILLMFAKNDGTLRVLFDNSQQSHEVTLGLVISSLYFIMPLLWTMVISWAGYAGVQAIGSAADRTAADAQSVGQTVSNIIDKGFYQASSTAQGLAVGSWKAAKWYLFEKQAVMKAQEDFKLGKKILDALKKENEEAIKKTSSIIKENEQMEKQIDRYKAEKGGF